jgi:hypothetical protein
MKFETRKTKANPGYQIEFKSSQQAWAAGAWLKQIGLIDWSAGGGMISTADLEVAYKLRVHFDHHIKLIRKLELH